MTLHGGSSGFHGSGGTSPSLGFFDRLAIGWGLTKSSFGVLKLDKEILLLPVLSGLSVIALFALTLGPLAYSVLTTRAGFSFPWAMVAFLVLYFGAAFLTIFFNVGIIHMATMRFQGQDPVVRDGLSFAWQRKGGIFVWALFSATVGLLLNMIEQQARQRAGFLGDLLMGGVKIAWAGVTFIALPALVYRGLGPIGAIREAVGIIRQRWGESIGAVGALWLIAFLLALPGIFLVFAAFWLLFSSGVVAFAVVLALAILSVLFVAILTTALNGIVQSALYLYATTGRMPQAFDARWFAPGAPRPVGSTY